MKIAHISDTHITHGGSFVRESFEQIVELIKEEKCDFVVHTGDVTNTGLKEDYELARKLLKAVPRPMVVLMGNHDARNVGYELFRYYVGAPNGAMSGDDYAVIYVDSTVPDLNDGRVGRIKYDWLKERLKEYSDKPMKIVALHHHVLPVPSTGRERNVLYNAGDLLDLFLKYDVRLVLCGHRHYPNVYRIEELVVANAGCVSCAKTRVGDANSFNLIEIDGEAITVQTRRVGRKEVTTTYPVASYSVFVPAGERRARIVQMSGTCISNTREFNRQKFDNAVRKINSLKPDVVVHCGGIVNEGLKEEYALASRLLEAIAAEVLFTPGSRDIDYLGYKLFPQHFGGRQEHVVSDLHFKALYSAQYDSEVGVVGQTELDSLTRELDAHPSGFRCLFLHHNLLPIPHLREKGLLEDCGDVLKRFCDLGVDLVLTGHASHPFAARIEDTIVVNSNSLSGRKQRSAFGNSFNVIDIYDDLVYVSEIHSLWGSRRILGIWRHEDRVRGSGIGDGSEKEGQTVDAGGK